MLPIDLSGKKALVCGSSQGIGKSIAEKLALAGAKVDLMARNEEALRQAIADLPGKGHGYFVVDFNEPTTLVAHSKALTDKGYDILVNNTGGPAPGPVHQASWDSFDQAINMHLRMSHQLVHYLLPSMKQKKYGRVINVISTSVKIPLDGLGVSNTVRGAMASWAKTLANELGPFQITVNNLLPGFMETQRLQQIITNKSKKLQESEETVMKDMKKEVPAQRFGLPEEMGSIAAFLASPLAAYINGVSIPVDGGRTGSI